MPSPRFLGIALLIFLLSFGVTAVLGEITCLTAALVALPAVLILLRDRLRTRDP